jgi:hypothetical protein
VGFQEAADIAFWQCRYYCGGFLYIQGAFLLCVAVHACILFCGAASEADSGAGETFKGEKDACCEYSCNNGDAYYSFSAVVCRLYGVSRT